jgi:hypothetical protein
LKKAGGKKASREAKCSHLGHLDMEMAEEVNSWIYSESTVNRIC